MADLNELQGQFSIPGKVIINAGNGGLTRIAVNSDRARAEIYLNGGHVTNYQPAGREPVLFVSRKSHYAAGKAIRGGIPVIFPWFGAKADDPAAPQHGFARSMEWELRDVHDIGGATAVALALSASDATRRWLPNDFEVLYTISVGSTLDLIMEVRNLSDEPMRFEEALHTYFQVGDVRNVTIDGLGGRTFIDKVDRFQRKAQTQASIRITGETDRVYLDTPDTVAVTDPGMQRRISVSKEGSLSTVIWNPWTEKAKAMSDFAEDEWPRMLCVETANAAENAVTLDGGENHTMRASISAQPL